MIGLERRGFGCMQAPTRERGFAIVDVLCATGLMAVLGAMAVPSLTAWLDRDSARLSARYLAGRLQYARAQALARNVEVAVRFGDADEEYAFAVFADGNGNGVLERDIAAGVDVPIAPPEHLGDHFRGIGLRIVDAAPGIDGGEAIAVGSDPLRIGRSHLLSFSPLGSCTSGTLYIAGSSSPQAAIRILGVTGRVRVLWFNRASRAWQAD